MSRISGRRRKVALPLRATVTRSSRSSTSRRTAEVSHAVFTTASPMPSSTPMNMSVRMIASAVAVRTTASPRCSRQSGRMVVTGMSFAPAWDEDSGAGGHGDQPERGGEQGREQQEPHPVQDADALVRAPACTLAALRTMTAVMGSAPTRPQRVLPAPWAMSSLLYWVRGPSCIRSTAAALGNRGSARR
ncbi:hypothetical protein SCALM49S_09004 [Streptomyces californicus]